MGSLLSRLKPYRASVVLSLALVMVQALGELGLPTLMAGIIDHGVLNHDQPAVLLGGAEMLAVALAGALASVAASWVSARLAAGFGRDVRSAVFRKTTTMSVDTFATLGAASLITRVTNDVTQVQSFVVMSLRMLAMAPLMAIGGLVMAFTLDPGLALVLGVAVPVLGLAMVLLAGRAMTLFRLVQQKIDRLNLVLRESLTGVRVLRAFDRQKFDAERFHRANVDLSTISLQTQKLMALVMPGMMLIMSLTTVALMWFGAGRLVAGTLQVGGLMAFIQYATQILFSLMMMSMLFVLLPRATVSAGRINDILEVPDAPESPRDPGPGSRDGGSEIEFRHVTFRYPGAEKPALDDVSFVVPRGGTTGIIGGTGSGKTTILQLMVRFHDVTSGQVLVDGKDVTQWTRAALRRRFGLAPQKARLFTGTVAENLRWGDVGASDGELQEALSVAQAADFVSELPGGLQGALDKGGANLSGGQKQRLAIARVLVRRPAVALFDDSFSALDAKTDVAVRTGLGTRIQATVVMVAQRVATVRDADRILVLDEGRVAGVGSHATLLETCEVYREIVASQLGSEETP